MRKILVALAAAALLAGFPLMSSSAATPTPAGKVWVGGTPTAGGTWAARTSGWPTATTFVYRWYIDSTLMKTSISSDDDTYVVPATYFNHKVSLKVTGTAPGDTGTNVTLAALRVQVANPLAGDQWNPPDGPYQYKWDGTAWVSQSGTVYAPAAIQNRPRVTWFPGPSDKSRTAVATQISTQMSVLGHYIDTSQNGDPEALTQLAVFGIYSVQGGEGYLHTALTNTEVANYHTWITALARTLGQTRVAIVLEPDLAITTNPAYASDATRQAMTKWAAATLSQDKHAAIYLSAGDADWLSPTQAANLLKASGIQYVRGFDLGDTHYSTLGSDIMQGAAIVKALSALGYTNRHFVVDTSDNGKGFGFSQDPTRAVCASKSSPPPCVTLGVPPTWQVIDTHNPLNSTQAYYALRLQDADLWIGRPWNQDQAWPFLPARARQLAASSPYA